jgi:hypothetical protein
VPHGNTCAITISRIECFFIWREVGASYLAYLPSPDASRWAKMLRGLVDVGWGALLCMQRRDVVIDDQQRVCTGKHRHDVRD